MLTCVVIYSDDLSCLIELLPFFMNVIPQARYPMLENPESLRKSADDFLTHAAMTDAGLLFPPSQIALTAILNSASRASLNIER